MKNRNSSMLSEGQMKELLKLEALILNRVRGLEWFYFDLKLPNESEKVRAQSGVQALFEAKETEPKILDLIKWDGDRFDYSTDPNQRTTPPSPVEILNEVIRLISSHPSVPRNILRRIFDENEPSIRIKSEADKGLLGRVNRKTHDLREKIFQKRLQSPEFKENGVRILAEGDSWFMHPKIPMMGNVVKDIIDWLIEDNPNYAVYSMAAGGDWLSNMIRSDEYITMLARVSPDAFLFSGGGNDLMENSRVASLLRDYSQAVEPSPDSSPKAASLSEIHKKLLAKRKGLQGQHPEFDERKYERGLRFLNQEFFNLINITMSQYFLLLTELNSVEEFRKIKFISQGYDYGIPHSDPAPLLRAPLRSVVNRFQGAGRWLHQPMLMKKIFDPEDQQAIVYTMLWEFNEMLISLTDSFPNFYHIDTRGTAKGKDDWFDEIHLRNKPFRRIARAFKACIESKPENGRPAKKVFKVND